MYAPERSPFPFIRVFYFFLTILAPGHITAPPHQVQQFSLTPSHCDYRWEEQGGKYGSHGGEPGAGGHLHGRHGQTQPLKRSLLLCCFVVLITSLMASYLPVFSNLKNLFYYMSLKFLLPLCLLVDKQILCHCSLPFAFNRNVSLLTP